MSIFELLFGCNLIRDTYVPEEICVERDRIVFTEPYLYNDQRELIKEIRFDNIKKIEISCGPVDRTYTERFIMIEVFGDSYIKDFLIYHQKDRLFAKELFAAMNINFDVKKLFKSERLSTVVYQVER